jgi:hypothetical protein
MLRRTLDDVGLDVPELDFQIVRLDKTTAATHAMDLLRDEICSTVVRIGPRSRAP